MRRSPLLLLAPIALAGCAEQVHRTMDTALFVHDEAGAPIRGLPLRLEVALPDLEGTTPAEPWEEAAAILTGDDGRARLPLELRRRWSAPIPHGSYPSSWLQQLVVPLPNGETARFRLDGAQAAEVLIHETSAYALLIYGAGEGGVGSDDPLLAQCREQVAALVAKEPWLARRTGGPAFGAEVRAAIRAAAPRYGFTAIPSYGSEEQPFGLDLAEAAPAQPWFSCNPVLRLVDPSGKLVPGFGVADPVKEPVQPLY